MQWLHLWPLRLLLWGVATALCLLRPLTAADIDWANASGHTDWNDPNSWLGGVMPQNSDRVFFLSTSSILAMPSLSGTVTVGHLSINDSQADWNINGSGTIDLRTNSTSDGIGMASGGSTTISPWLNALSSQTWNISSNTTLSLYGGLGGSGDITKIGGGTVVLGASSSMYAGVISVNGGQLQLTSAAAPTALRVASVLGSTVSVSAAALQLGEFSGGGTLNLGANPLTVNTLGSRATGATITASSITVRGIGVQEFDGALGGLTSNFIVTQRAGAIVDTAVTTLSNTVLDGGTLTLSTSVFDPHPVSGSVTFNGGGTFLYDGYATTSTTSNPVLNVTGSLNLNSGQAHIGVNDNQANAFTTMAIWGALNHASNAATVDFFSGTGTLGGGTNSPRIHLETQANGFIGGWATFQDVGFASSNNSGAGVGIATSTSFNTAGSTSGALLSAGGTLGGSTDKQVVSLTIAPSGSNQTLDLTGSANVSASGVLLAGSTSFEIRNTGGGTGGLRSGGTYYFHVPQATLTVSTRLYTSSDYLVKDGRGTLVVNGSSSLTVATSINDGALRTTVGPGGFLSPRELQLAGGVLELQNGQTFNRTVSTGTNSVNWVASGGFAAYGGAATVDLNTLGTADNLVWGQSHFVTDTSSLIFGSLTADSRVTFVDNIALNSGTPTTYTQRSIEVEQANNTSSAYAQITGVISSVADANGGWLSDLVKTGSGTLELTGFNTYVGGTIVAEGTLLLANSHALGDASQSNAYVLVGGRNGNQVNAALMTSAGVSIDRDISVLSGNMSVFLGGATADNSTFSGNVYLDQTTQLSAAANGQVTFSGALSGPGSINKVGAGTIYLANSNLFSGSTNVSTGTLGVATAGALGVASSGVKITSGASLELEAITISGRTISTLSGGGVAGSGALRNAAGNAAWLGNITLGAAATINASVGTFTIGSASNTVNLAANTLSLYATAIATGVINSTITGSGGVAFTGPSAWTIAGANGYSGGTTISAGQVYLANSSGSALGSAAVTLAGGILSGTGTTTGNVYLASGGTIAPGSASSPGTLTLGGLSTTTSGTVNLNYRLGSGTNDLLYLSNVPTLSTPVFVNVSTFSGFQAQGQYALIQFGGSGSVNLNNLAVGTTPAGITYSFVMNGTNEIDARFNYLTGAATWTGAVNATWDHSVANWTTSALARPFVDGDSLFFADGASTSSISIAGALLPTSLTFANNCTDYTVAGSGTISGTASVNINGAGNVTLGSLNTFGGGTFVRNGALLVSESSRLSIDGSTIQSGPLGTGIVTLSGGVALGASGGTQTIANQIVLGSNVTFIGSSLAINSQSLQNANTVSLTSNVTMTIANGTTTIADGIYDGGQTYSLAVNGGGTLALTANNSYLGGTSVMASTLIVGSSGSIAAGTNLTVSGAAIAEFNNTQTLATIANNSSAAIGVSFSATTGTIALSLLTGSGATRIASNANITTFDSGTLTINGAAKINTLAGGTLTASSTATITAISAGTAYLFGQSTISTLSGGALNLNGANATVNTVSGGTVNAAGILTLSAVTGGVVNLNGANNYGITTLSGAGMVSIGQTGGTLTLRTGSFGGILTGAGSLVINSTVSALTLSGTNNYTGNTLITAGTLALSSLGNSGSTVTINPGTALRFTGTAAGALGSGTTLLDNGAVSFTGNQTLAALSGTGISNIATGATLSLQGGSFAGSIAGAGNLTIVNDTTITGTIGNTGTTQVNLAATLQIGAGGTSGSIAGTPTFVLAGTLLYDVASTTTFAGAVNNGFAASGRLLQAGGGTLDITGLGFYAGGIIVSAGTLNITSTGKLGVSVVGPSDLTVTGTSVARFDDSDQQLGVVRNNSSILQGLVFSANTGTVSISQLVGTSVASFASALSVGTFNSTATVEGSGRFDTIGGGAATVSGTANITELKQGSVALLGANSTVFSMSGGAAQLAGIGLFNTFSGGTLTLDGAATSTISHIAGSGTIWLGQNGARLSLSAGTFGGTITGFGELAINAGESTVALAGANAYSGSTSVNSGTLWIAPSGSISSSSSIDVAGSRLVNNGVIHSSVDVSGGGLVIGNGTFDTLTVGNGGVVGPGNSPGTITDANTAWNSGGKYIWEINQLASDGGTYGGGINAQGWDLWNTGTLAINGSFLIELLSLTIDDNAGLLDHFSAANSYEWLIATGQNGAFSGLSNVSINYGAFANDLGGGHFSLLAGNNASELLLDFTPVPEPSTLALTAMAVGALCCRNRRRSLRTVTLGREVGGNA